MKIAFLDTETTGLNFALGGDGSNSDDMIECCVTVWNDGEIEQTFCQKYWPTGPVNPEAQKVNGYTAEKWQAGQAIAWNANAARVFGNMIADCDMIAGAATAFDRDVLRSAFRKVRAPYPEKTHRMLDVQSLAMPLLLAGKISSVSLGAIAKFYGLGPVQHGAAEDVALTIAVFERLLADFWAGAMNTVGGQVAA